MKTTKHSIKISYHSCFTSSVATYVRCARMSTAAVEYILTIASLHDCFVQENFIRFLLWEPLGLPFR